VWQFYAFAAFTQTTVGFRVIAFQSAETEQAHMSFVHEANRWFREKGEIYGYTYDSTTNWNNLNADVLSRYQVVIFLDSRPDGEDQRAAFQTYMENNGAWMGFHFAGFALTPSDFPQNWEWYHNRFLDRDPQGQYRRPTPAIIRVEDQPSGHRTFARYL
jgi:hypothetical protein